MSGDDALLRVAVPVPVRSIYHYLPPPDRGGAALAAGCRLRVPFGNGTRIAVLLGIESQPDTGRRRLKRVLEVLDSEPLLDSRHLRFLSWAADYYHHPIGETVAMALPPLLRRGREARLATERCWRLRAGWAEELGTLQRAPRQRAMLEWLAEQPRQSGSPASLRAAFGDGWKRLLDALLARGLVREAAAAPPVLDEAPAGYRLNQQQQRAVRLVRETLGEFHAFLLQGVTGSGKTEVYVRVARQVVAEGRQALILIPEIGLTSQTVQRFRARIRAPTLGFHSGLTESERLNAWLQAHSGTPSVIVGTRSAIWMPLPKLGLIVVDEEHDGSYKQQDGMRYSARDLALVRGQQAGVPVILGSATPSLESLYNVRCGRYRQIRLTRRAGAAQVPEVELVDVRNLELTGGLSAPLLREIADFLAAGRQVLIFLNRRGYAPVLLCHACGGRFRCRRCDTNLSLHRSSARLRCHWCGAAYHIPPSCPTCEETDFVPVGVGTERIEQALSESFPDARIVRIDSDTTRSKGSLQNYLEQAASGAADILVGTQMLSKGHHFPAVGLVCVVDGDAGLYSADFRGAERLAQTIVQVSGRAGRANAPGRVLIQTHHPRHSGLRLLVEHGYETYSGELLEERRSAELPPYGHLVLLRAESSDGQRVETFLHECRQLAERLAEPGIEVWGPTPAPLARIAGRARWQLIVQSARRARLQHFLEAWVSAVAAGKSARRLRWSLDVDPQEML